MKNKHLLYSVFLLIAVLMTVFSSYGGYSTFFSNHYDDAYISYRYAINLAEGNGLVFNVGEKADAASSLLYTVILAVFYKLGAHNLELVSGAINILSLLAIGVLVYQLCYYIIDNTIISMTMACLVSVHGFMSGWAASGMETVFYTALLTLFVGVTFVWEESRPKLSLVLMILLLLTRHDSLLIVPFWATVNIAKFFEYYEIRDLPWVRNRIKYCIIFLAVLVIYYGLRYWYYGVIIPHAVQAKQIMIYYQPDPKETINYWVRFASPVLFFALGVIGYYDYRLRLAGVFLIFSLVVYAMGARVDWIRYSAPLLPIVGILAMRTIRKLHCYRRGEGYTALIVLFFLFFGYSTFGSVNHYRGKILGYKTAQEYRIAIGEQIANNIPTDKLIISGDIGAIAYKAKDHRFIDLTGLTSPEILRRYKAGESLDSYLGFANPGYIADTFMVENNVIKYERFDANKFINQGVNGEYQETNDLKVIDYKQVGRNIVIALCEIRRKKGSQ